MLGHRSQTMGQGKGYGITFGFTFFLLFSAAASSADPQCTSSAGSNICATAIDKDMSDQIAHLQSHVLIGSKSTNEAADETDVVTAAALGPPQHPRTWPAYAGLRNLTCKDESFDGVPGHRGAMDGKEYPSCDHGRYSASCRAAYKAGWDGTWQGFIIDGSGQQWQCMLDVRLCRVPICCENEAKAAGSKTNLVSDYCRHQKGIKTHRRRRGNPPVPPTVPCPAPAAPGPKPPPMQSFVDPPGAAKRRLPVQRRSPAPPPTYVRCSSVVKKNLASTGDLVDEKPDKRSQWRHGPVVEDVLSSEDCAALCGRKPGCKHWTYVKDLTHKDVNKCFLKRPSKQSPEVIFETDSCCDSGSACKEPSDDPLGEIKEGVDCVANHGFETDNWGKAVSKDHVCPADAPICWDFQRANGLQNHAVQQWGVCRTEVGRNRIYKGSQVYPHDIMTQNCPNPVMQTQCMTTATYKSIAGDIAAVLKSLAKHPCTASDCKLSDWAGCVLRMQGHDFMDFIGTDRLEIVPFTDHYFRFKRVSNDGFRGGGGADGCTDMSHPDNKGLQACLTEGEHGHALVTIYEKYCGQVSLADFLVIAAEAVIKELGGPDLGKHFAYGRTTAKECPEAAKRLPNPERGCAALEETFRLQMGLTWTETAALMGVHTLGKARVENSGYSGFWTDARHSAQFDNNYFISLRNKGWQPQQSICGNPNKNQWFRNGPGIKKGTAKPHGEATEMMLNSDLCLAYDIFDGAQHENCCAWQERFGHVQPDVCGDVKLDCANFKKLTGKAGSAVELFAVNQTAWFEVFALAWDKVTTNGFDGLRPLEDKCSADGAAPFTLLSPDHKGEYCKDGLVWAGTWYSKLSVDACEAKCAANPRCKYFSTWKGKIFERYSKGMDIAGGQLAEGQHWRRFDAPGRCRLTSTCTRAKDVMPSLVWNTWPYVPDIQIWEKRAPAPTPQPCAKQGGDAGGAPSPSRPYSMTDTGSYCAPGSDVTTPAECHAAADSLGKQWATAWNGPGDHKFCFFADDGRSLVYFNTAGSSARSTPSPRYASICKEAGQCQDTPHFDNGHGYNCAKYRSHGWCANGAARPGHEWTLGAAYKFPEQHCCVCGKPAAEANGPAQGAWINLVGRSASQISVAHGGSASRAIDGNAASNYPAGSCTHTNRQQGAWWQVDLGSAVTIDRVKVTNRGDCCGSRLNGFNVLVDGQACASNVAINEGQTKEVACTATGQTVKVQLPGNGVLTICEFAVHGASQASR